MNGADSSDDENGVLYFLPGGIADDSPPRRTLDMSSPVPSSFGYIGAAQSSTTTTQNFRMTPVAATEPNNSLLSGLGGVAVPNKPAARDRPLGGGGFGSFGGYGYGGRFGGSPGESSTPANGGGVGSIGSSSFLGPNTNAGAASSQPIQTPSSSTFARSPFMSTTTSSSGGPLRAPPGLDIPLPSAAGSSFLQPQHRMLDRKDESLRAAFGFLQHSSPAPTTHLEQPPPATASNMFGRSGYQQSNKDLAELNTTSVVVVQKPPSRLHLEDQHDYGTGSNSIGVHRFRNTFLEPPPSDDLGTSPSSHPPPVPVRAGSTPRVTGGGRPYGSEPKERGKDKFHGKRHGSPSSASSFDSDVHAAPSSSTLNSTPSSPMHFVDQRPVSSSPHVAAQPQRVVPGQIRIKQRGGDGMSPKKPTAEVPVASGPQRTSSRGAATSTAVPPPHSTRRPLYREKFPKGAPSDGPPPLATVPKSDRSTPRRGTRADKSLVSGGAAAPPSIPTDVASTTTTTTNTRRTATKANPVQQARPHVSPRRENLYSSLLVDEPIAAPVLEVEGEGPTAPDESTDGDEMVSQDGRGDDDPSSIPAVANKASNVEDDNVCVGRDDSDEDGSAQDNVSTSADTSPSSSPREERVKAHDDAATPDDLPPLEEDVMTPGPSPIACHDESPDKPEVVASATPPQPQEFHPPSSEDDMPARPPSSSKKRSDKKSRRTTDASSAAVSGAAKGSVDKRKGDGSGLKQPSSSHKKQDPHGKNDADASGAHPAGSPPPQRTPDDDDDDDDLFAPVPRSAWSVAKSAVVSTCVWLVAFSGASTGLPWLLVHAHWLASTLLSLAFHCGFHVLSFGLKFHRFVVRGLIFNRNIASCFAFLYLFPLLVQYVIPWAPPWAPVCLWYAFLVQLFCTQGSTAMVATFRILLPLVFLVEGVSHHSFLLDLNGAELLLISFILSAVKTGNLYSPVFFLSMSLQCLSAVFLGSEMFVQWIQLAVALYSLHAMASDEWVRRSS
ncbi:hypothetical protein, variant 1 [Aphanomyces astaci]|uniref:Transmembrane protein n=1 Tax=Aphanomyces astaci TaxID=112090 RepID=W4G209_APHAT|nr:hypothetical protein, variant 1 [Aphanomyces astaci]ETV73725.1 hypothetical protein, variant 1 [Aphanomyces astaci]|eukprot:XP_009836660.1 hypothetical protein, variant 1 [Aphanomyces astaci]